MDQQPLLEHVALVGLSLPLPLFAVAVDKYRGSPFGCVLALLTAALGFGIVATMVDAFSLPGDGSRLVVLALVGGAAALSVAGATQLARMTTGRCSL